MRKYILATHGKMAGGMQSTLEMIAGEQENLTCINAYTDECKDQLAQIILKRSYRKVTAMWIRL